jgi:hypothetical protein
MNQWYIIFNFFILFLLYTSKSNILYIE